MMVIYKKMDDRIVITIAIFIWHTLELECCRNFAAGIVAIIGKTPSRMFSFGFAACTIRMAQLYKPMSGGMKKKKIGRTKLLLVLFHKPTLKKAICKHLSSFNYQELLT